MYRIDENVFFVIYAFFGMLRLNRDMLWKKAILMVSNQARHAEHEGDIIIYHYGDNQCLIESHLSPAGINVQPKMKAYVHDINSKTFNCGKQNERINILPSDFVHLKCGTRHLRLDWICLK